ncbi:type-F conjugative transfer system pilin assembly protein TraF, partial [Escherichia coli]|nr:type-F conjugative transfer system pilin assembly protein TraF [Escherichia coli]EFN5035352.1 type-F conjugative transfer system pilin assembly protein TraF [Escherichia coli]EHH5103719.1 type-F conjugative transfer system pilin assembly protein TraF [Escherichia coli]EKC4035870.1 type-F conjugative transfer system pilin assembly protein TraF [Escherichia coli]EKC4035874.1 type-F conjugative transfer system pilin assembly protein TraF [Escherichia coli]
MKSVMLYLVATISLLVSGQTTAQREPVRTYV